MNWLPSEIRFRMITPSRLSVHSKDVWASPTFADGLAWHRDLLHEVD